ncbi:MAG TPA: DNA replication/repair protein RecF [Lysobacter sp.]
MHVTRLEIRNLRRFAEVNLAPGPGLNLITGDNGAGKTSVLEALHLMAYGRSFRGRVRDGLIRTNEAALEVFVEWQEASGPGVRRAGLRHAGHEWSGRLDGAPVAYLGDLCAALAVVTFEPGSHSLIMGTGDVRRRYLDWGLFHVEPGFLGLWRRYARALRQRNALLKRRGAGPQLDAWDREVAEAGESLGRGRQRYLEALQPHFAALMAEWAPALGNCTLEYLPGWRREELPLTDALLMARDRDLLHGFTSVGPHRADWRIGFGNLPGKEALSRGQAKLTALSALMAQAEHYAGSRGEWPIVALDDMASELDRAHQGRVLDWLLRSQAQVFLTGTEAPEELKSAMGIHRFHVEQGLLESVEPGVLPAPK